MGGVSPPHDAGVAWELLVCPDFVSCSEPEIGDLQIAGPFRRAGGRGQMMVRGAAWRVWSSSSSTLVMRWLLIWKSSRVMPVMGFSGS
jgi:hypothetical protein